MVRFRIFDRLHCESSGIILPLVNFQPLNILYLVESCDYEYGNERFVRFHIFLNDKRYHFSYIIMEQIIIIPGVGKGED